MSPAPGPRVLIAAEQRPWLRKGAFVGRQQLGAFLGLPDLAQVTVLAREAEPEPDGVPVLPGASALALNFSPRRPLRTLRAINQAVGRAHVVAVNTPGVVGAVVGLVALSRRRPVVAVVVGDGRAVTDAIAPTPGLRRLALLATHTASRLVAARASVVRYVTIDHLQRAYPAGRHARVHAATDVNLATGQNEPLRNSIAPTGPWRLLVVGTMERAYKGVADAIEAVARLQSCGTKVTLTVVGDGRLRSRLKERAALTCTPGSVEFTGGLFGAELQEIIKRHDVFVQASHTEGLARVLIEAVWGGLLVVATDVGGTREVVAPACLTPAREPAALSQRLGALLEDEDSRVAASRLTRALVSRALERRAEVHPAFLRDVAELGRRRTVAAHVFGVMDRGGAELRTIELMEAMGDRVEAHYLTLQSRPGVLDARIRASGGTIHPIALGPCFPVAYIRCLRSIHADVLDSHVATFSGVLVLLARMAGVRRRIAHFRSDGDDHGDSPRRRLQRVLMRRLIRAHSTDIVGVSPSSLEFGYMRRWAEDPRTVVIANGVPIDEPPPVADLRQQLSIPDETLLLMHVGRPSPEKNRARLPSMVAAVATIRPANLILVGGTGPDAGVLRSAVASAGVADLVHEVGSTDNVRSLLAQADVVVQPSIREGLPGVVLEALSVGTPVVSSDVPGSLWLAERLRGVTTLPLMAADSTWAHAIVAAASQSSREELRCAFARSDFAFDRAVERHWHLYEKS